MYDMLGWLAQEEANSTGFISSLAGWPHSARRRHVSAKAWIQSDGSSWQTRRILVWQLKGMVPEDENGTIPAKGR